jgi:hypothetical protein
MLPARTSSGIVSMSDNFMIVLPVDPFAVPSKERAEATLELLSKLRPDVQEVELRTSETPEFFCCLGNFESVYCPFCQTDVEKWWGKAMDAWWHGDRRLLSVTTPCCGRVTSLNDLDYNWPQGFACVAFELMNPDSDLEPEELQRVEKTLGLPMHVMWKHV